MHRMLHKRYLSILKDTLLTQCLKERTLIRLSGNDASIYLQGLITNDMTHLQEGALSIFAMFLNSKGRVLLETIIYNAKKENSYLIECDESAIYIIQDHLRTFKVRRKLSIDCLKDELDIWAVVLNTGFWNPSNVCNYGMIGNLIQQNLPDVMLTKDPRLSNLGLRVITPKNYNLSKEIEQKTGVKVEEKKFYKLLRYKLGISEGLNELPLENCFPMEANGDYLHGISFHKGCYIGQELTARTYHTGVTRKRIMPLQFDEVLKTTEYGIPVYTVPRTNKPVGRLQGVEKTSGVALLRIDEALSVTGLRVLNTMCKTHRPFWWPSKAPKEMPKAG